MGKQRGRRPVRDPHVGLRARHVHADLPRREPSRSRRRGGDGRPLVRMRRDRGARPRGRRPHDPQGLAHPPRGGLRAAAGRPRPGARQPARHHQLHADGHQAARRGLDDEHPQCRQARGRPALRGGPRSDRRGSRPSRRARPLADEGWLDRYRSGDRQARSMAQRQRTQGCRRKVWRRRQCRERQGRRGTGRRCRER
jgi:hypothetical protein